MTLKNLEAGRPNQSCHVKNPAIAEKFHNAHMFKKYQRYTVKEAQAKKKKSRQVPVCFTICVGIRKKTKFV